MSWNRSRHSWIENKQAAPEEQGWALDTWHGSCGLEALRAALQGSYKGELFLLNSNEIRYITSSPACPTHPARGRGRRGSLAFSPAACWSSMCPSPQSPPAHWIDTFRQLFSLFGGNHLIKESWDRFIRLGSPDVEARPTSPPCVLFLSLLNKKVWSYFEGHPVTSGVQDDLWWGIKCQMHYTLIINDHTFVWQLIISSSFSCVWSCASVSWTGSTCSSVSFWSRLKTPTAPLETLSSSSEFVGVTSSWVKISGISKSRLVSSQFN